MTRQGSTPRIFTRDFIQAQAEAARTAQRKRYVFANDPDYNLRGYRLDISKHGAVRFVLSYKSPTGQRRTYTLGAWPGTTDAEARRRVLALRAELNRGHDPMSIPRTEARLPNGPLESAALPNGTERGSAQWQ